METSGPNEQLAEVTELRKSVSEKQADIYAEAVVKLMERTNDNPELVNALRDFVKELGIKSWRGGADQSLSEGYVGRLTEFFKEKTEELKRLT